MNRATLCLTLCCLASSTDLCAQESKPADPVLTTVQQAIDWIARQAVPVKGTPDAVLFPETAESAPDAGSIVYGGTAGVLIFLENAAAVLNDARARALADQAAAGLLATRGKDPSGAVTWAKSTAQPGAVALYIGDAGIGHAFLIRAELRGDAAARRTAIEIGDSIIARGIRHGDSLQWVDGQVDIIYGAAGTMLFLLALGEETHEARFLEAARAAGHWVAAQAAPAPTGTDSRKAGRCWMSKLGGDQNFPNFSHGTAGIAYALARVGAATKDATCTAAATDGAEWLLQHAIRDASGLRWSAVAGGTMCLAGWCHGPPGTARLFLLLHRQTREQRYLDAALESAQWVMAQSNAAQAGRGAAGAFPPSYCCGVAGVLDFFCELHCATGKQEYADFAQKAGAYLVGAAQHDAQGVKWLNGASMNGGKPAEHGVDLMLGASGEALALLRLSTIGRPVDPLRHLPDRSVGGK